MKEQRVIKFRAWDIKFQEIVEVSELQWSERLGKLYPSRLKGKVGVWYSPFDDQCILMQSVGRTDLTPPWEDIPREGSKDLYEGDVVEAWVSRYPDSKIKGSIEYNPHAQAFQLRYENAFGGHANEFLHRYHFFNILGNLHQHKHLIE
jgi:uncharacterized phage protein (TIGR01671 family)